MKVFSETRVKFDIYVFSNISFYFFCSISCSTNIYIVINLFYLINSV
jgi:hypothetical protein